MTKLEEFKEWLRMGRIFSRHAELLNCDREDKEFEKSTFKLSIQGKSSTKRLSYFRNRRVRVRNRELVHEIQIQEEARRNHRGTKFKKWWLFGLAIAVVVGVIAVGLKVNSTHPREKNIDFKKGCDSIFGEDSYSSRLCERLLTLLKKEEQLIIQIKDQKNKLEKYKRNLIGKTLEKWEVEELSRQQDELSKLEKKLEILERRREKWKEAEDKKLKNLSESLREL